MFKIINLPVYGIVVELDGQGGGTIRSDFTDGTTEDANDPEDIEYAVACNTVESVILAHAIAGVDVSSAPYVAGITQAVQEILNHF